MLVFKAIVLGLALFFSIVVYSNSAMAATGKIRGTPLGAEVLAAFLWMIFYFLNQL